MGLYTSGVPVATTLTGSETIPADTNLPNGEYPSQTAIPVSLLTGAIPPAADGSVTPVNTPYASTITLDGDDGFIQTIGELTGGLLLANPENIIPGPTYRVRITQDSGGSHAITFGNKWLLSGSFTTTASYVAWMSFWYDGTTYYASVDNHYA